MRHRHSGLFIPLSKRKQAGFSLSCQPLWNEHQQPINVISRTNPVQEHLQPVNVIQPSLTPLIESSRADTEYLTRRDLWIRSQQAAEQLRKKMDDLHIRPTEWDQGSQLEHSKTNVDPKGAEGGQSSGDDWIGNFIFNATSTSAEERWGSNSPYLTDPHWNGSAWLEF